MFEYFSLFCIFVQMKNFRRLAYNLLGVVICVLTLFIACMFQTDTTETTERIIGKVQPSDTKQHFDTADKAFCLAVEGAREISVPTSSFVRVLSISAIRILPALHQQICHTQAKSASFFNSRHLRLYEVAAPFACARLKEYFIYALRRIII